MKKRINAMLGVLGASAALGAASAPVHAADIAGLTIARNNACLGCHDIQNKRVGPSFHQIAAKYKGDASKQVQLENKVRNGSTGTWGILPMPAQPSMSSADIRAVVAWILAGAPAK